MNKVPSCFSVSVEIESVEDVTRPFPVKDANGNPTDKMKDHRIITATGYAKTLDGKRERGFQLKWFDPAPGVDLPAVGKTFMFAHFRSITEEKNNGYTVNF